MSDGDGADDAGDDVGPPNIRALDRTTVQRIAAGEVVERPASVVKELVENSLDADATRVAVAVESGGKGGIRVRDDGVGMTETDLEIAVEEHTTSKISDIDDLEAGVGTLGFRGEALHTVGAVSRLTVRSKARGSDGAGAELTVEGGDVGDVRPAGCPEGTTVEVDDLFFNTPARKKFLKTDATEFDHVNTVVTQYALANPDVAVSLDHNGREVFATEGRGSRESTVLSVYGREVAEAMVEVDADTEREGGPVDGVSGLVSHPETTRAGREYLSTFVNGRYVTSSVLREAVLDAYGGQLAPDRYPFAVLFVDVPPTSVDVNVHPRKMEVRFDDESGVKAAIEEAVKGALLDAGLVRSSAPRGRSAPEQTEINPEREAVGGAGTGHERASGVGGAGSAGSAGDVDGDGDSSSAGDGDDSGGVESGGDCARPPSRTEVDAETDAVEAATDAADEDAWVVDNVGGGGDSTEDASPSRMPDWDLGDDWPSADADSDGDAGSAGSAGVERDARTDETDAVADDVHGSSSARAERRPSPRAWQESDDVGSSGDVAGADATPDAESSASGGDGARDGQRAVDSARDAAKFGVAVPTSQRTLDGDEAAVGGEYDSLPSMRVLGQLHDTYVVAETADGMVLVDQHAADERVNYERLRREFADGATTQALADPVELELTAREAALFEEYADGLASVGFRAERVGERTVEVASVPAVFDAALDPELLRDALTAFVADADGGREAVDAVADSLLADLACYPSITGNTSLTEGSVVDLLAALDACENPYACPHGRPVVIAFGTGEIEDRFERDYPGHAGRRREE